MAQTYTVKLVNEEEWKDLVRSDKRYEHVTDENFGFADRIKRQGYARLKYLKDFPGAKALTLQHEFEHLTEEHPTDADEYGIQHKKFFKQMVEPLISPIASPFFRGGFKEGIRDLGRTLTAGATGFALGGPVGAGIGIESQALRNAVTPPGTKDPLTGRSFLGAAGTGAASGALGAGVGNAFGLGGRSATTSGLTGTPTGGISGQGFSSGSVGNLPSGFGALAPNQPGQPLTGSAALSAFNRGAVSGGNVFSPLTSGGGLVGSGFGNRLRNFFGGGSGGGGGGGGGGSGGGFFSNLLGSAAGSAIAGTGLGRSSFSNVAIPVTLGTGLALYGQNAPQGQPPTIPQYSQLPSIQQFNQSVQRQLGPLATQFSGVASQAGNLATTALPEALASPIRRQFDLERRNLFSQFAAFRPGADLATDSEYRRAVEDLDQRQAESLAQVQLNYQGNQRQNLATQMQALTSQLGVTEEQLNSLGGLAQLDLETIREQTGLNAQQAQQFKELFGNLGATVAGAGILGAFR